MHKCPRTIRAVLTPLSYLASRWTPSPRTVRRAAFAAVLMSVVIVVTGGAVRLTGSGLGCDTWPKCTGDSLIVTQEQGFHGVIEFGNRMLTYVLSAAVGWAIITARCAKPWRRSLTRLGWLQFAIVMGNAVLGGITVLTGLNPYSVAGHFLLATSLIAVTTITWQRTREGDGPSRPRVPAPVRKLAWALLAATAVLIAAGTVVTGSGPHAGDSSEIKRMPFDWSAIAHVHAVSAWVVCALAVAMWLVLRVVDAPVDTRARARDLLIVLLSQGAIGYVQYFTDVPEALVAAHMLGSCVVWISAVRVVLSLRERPSEQAGLPAQDDARLAAV
ncbi:heme A synthase [Streptomyces sp. AP-93]|uniref:COX15/CtaA family protein n=1 Tax=Streptomyces sp. AP-93 TaxID=2929048 RepID=UPI001FAF3DEB|nr:COX15/CtaA family protein [Streptomyces sp. AP-93]MCJ0872802.1 COX15/CtaA family protein [Streptomyces sp. AP-93]